MAARGSRRVTGVTIRTGRAEETIACDVLVLSLGLVPRDNLIRQATAASVTVESVGDVAGKPATPGACSGGFVCLCEEDVTVDDLGLAWDEGYQGTELLKRYTTATMGPCQGAMCHGQLRGFVAGRSTEPLVALPTTARPPARPVRLEDVAAGARYPLEWHTALHERHLEMGATMEWAGIWKRAERYGDTIPEYQAVRDRVSVMDVSTLGKYYGSPAATPPILERRMPITCWVHSSGRAGCRYALLLNENGYVFDDGLVGSLGPDGYILTFTSSGADGIESWLRDWVETWERSVRSDRESDRRRSAPSTGRTAGPGALAEPDPGPSGRQSLPWYSGIAAMTVAGVELPRAPGRVRGRAVHRAASSAPRRASSCGMRCSKPGGPSGSSPTRSRPCGCSGSKRVTSSSGRTPISIASPGKLGLEWAVKMEKPCVRREDSRSERIGRTRWSPSWLLESLRLQGRATLPEGGAPWSPARRPRSGISRRRGYSPVLGTRGRAGVGSYAWVAGSRRGERDRRIGRSVTGTMTFGSVLRSGRASRSVLEIRSVRCLCDRGGFGRAWGARFRFRLARLDRGRVAPTMSSGGSVPASDSVTRCSSRAQDGYSRAPNRAGRSIRPTGKSWDV